jgi:hypothetical protein
VRDFHLIRSLGRRFDAYSSSSLLYGLIRLVDSLAESDRRVNDRINIRAQGLSAGNQTDGFSSCAVRLVTSSSFSPWHKLKKRKLPLIRHFAAGPRTFPANLGALLHQFIVIEALAVIGALGTYIGAQAAGAAVHRRRSQHKIGACQANISAVQQQAYMGCIGMRPTHFQAVSDRFQADAVAVQTFANALAHLFGNLVVSS